MGVSKKWISRMAGIFAMCLIFTSVMPFVALAKGGWSGNTWEGKTWNGHEWEGSDWEGSDWEGDSHDGGSGHDGSSHDGNSHNGGGGHDGSSHDGNSHNGGGGHDGSSHDGNSHNGGGGHDGSSHDGNSHDGNGGYDGLMHDGHSHSGSGGSFDGATYSGNGAEGESRDWKWWLSKGGSVLAKSGLGYFAFRNGGKLLSIIDGPTGQITGYALAGRNGLKNPVLNFLNKIGRKPLMKNGTEVLRLGVNNHYNSFGPSLKFNALAKGNIAISSAVGLASAYAENNGNILSSGFVSSAVTEAGFAWGTTAVASAAGSWAAGALAGAAAGSSVPVVGTIIGAAVGVGISLALSTETGQKIKNAVKTGIKKGIDGVVSGAKKVGSFIKGLFS